MKQRARAFGSASTIYLRPSPSQINGFDMQARHHIRNWDPSAYNAPNENCQDTIVVSGRDRWALECLVNAADKGCTPIDTPGPRWSAYVYNLRKMGVCIETLNEPHKGPFAGTHARYVLRSTVTHVVDAEVAA